MYIVVVGHINYLIPLMMRQETKLAFKASLLIILFFFVFQILSHITLALVGDLYLKGLSLGFEVSNEQL